MATVNVSTDGYESDVFIEKSFTIEFSQTLNWDCELEATGETTAWFQIENASGNIVKEVEHTSPARDSYSGSVSASSTGTWKVRVYSSGADNYTIWADGNVHYSLDSTAPTITFDPENKGSADYFSVTITASDSESGVNNVWYQWTHDTSTPSSWTSISNGGSTEIPGQGEWYLHAKAEDKAGNITTDYSGLYILFRDLLVNQSGTYENAQGIYVKESGSWVQKELYLNESGTYARKL